MMLSELSHITSLLNTPAGRLYSYDRLFYSLYGYDGGTTRTYKYSMDLSPNWVNGRLEAVNFNLHNAMFYPNAYINFNNNGYYTKHYYNGTERIASRLGDQNLQIHTNDPELQDRKDWQDSNIRRNITEITSYQFLEPGQEPDPDDPKPVFELPQVGMTGLQPIGGGSVYYYHPNHLGSTCYVTDGNASVVQGFLYAPFGEITNEHNSSFGNGVIPKYSFNAKELDEETGMYYYEARYYQPPVFISRDVLFEEKPWFTPYHYCSNNPVVRLDPSGMLDGDYYTKDGKWLGRDEEKDDKVYVASGMSVVENKDGTTTTTFNDSKDLGIKHTTFCQIANILKNESSNGKDETLWIAHAANNEAKRRGKSLYRLLKSSYSSTSKKGSLSPTNTSAAANVARAAIISVYTGEADPTGGATQWDGVDFLAWGLQGPESKSHAKFREYKSISISTKIYKEYLSNIKEKYGNSVKFYGVSYTIPAAVFNDVRNWNNTGFFYNTGLIEKKGLKATGVRGHTIFWKTF